MIPSVDFQRVQQFQKSVRKILYMELEDQQLRVDDVTEITDISYEEHIYHILIQELGARWALHVVLSKSCESESLFLEAQHLVNLPFHCEFSSVMEIFNE